MERSPGPECRWDGTHSPSAAVAEASDCVGTFRIDTLIAIEPTSFERLLGAESVQMVFTDPPWNIPIEGNVSGLGAVKHGDFAMATGEMTPAQFEDFLTASLSQAARFSQDGSIHYICMHWTKVGDLLTATKGIYSELKALCVWNKTNAGMGSLYRSKHELICGWPLAVHVVYFDESPTQLIGDVRDPIPAAPGQLERYDCEYKAQRDRQPVHLSRCPSALA
jgi:hypothetical protein